MKKTIMMAATLCLLSAGGAWAADVYNSGGNSNAPAPLFLNNQAAAAAGGSSHAGKPGSKPFLFGADSGGESKAADTFQQKKIKNAQRYKAKAAKYDEAINAKMAAIEQEKMQRLAGQKANQGVLDRGAVTTGDQPIQRQMIYDKNKQEQKSRPIFIQ